jgi:hypothetical protein
MSDKIPSISLEDFTRRKYGMSDKIVVPEGMLMAAKDATATMRLNIEQYLFDTQTKMALEAALRWLSEHPILPTKEQIEHFNQIPSTQYTTDIIVEWQRIEFLAPDTEVCPIEKALLDSGVTVNNDWLCPECEGVHRAIIPKPEDIQSEREIIDQWLRKHQPNGSRVSLVGDKMAQELLNELEAYRRGQELGK